MQSSLLLELEWSMQLSMQNNAIKIREVEGYQGKCNQVMSIVKNHRD